MKLNKLSKKEKEVIVNKETEPPFSGEYEGFFESGIYLCRQCSAPLYRSEDKFEANCGWPSFDDEISKAVRRQRDVDGIRMEILCNSCGAHLGHVFVGEKLTVKNTRHCVNSLSMHFVPADFKVRETTFAVFGGGCFWCLESVFKELRGINSIVSGYAGGYLNSPSYEQVCSGKTGHAEVVKIYYDTNIINYETLLEIFFSVHDPTTLNRQGDDLGEQYRSVILYKTWQQKVLAENFIKELENDKIYSKSIVTELLPLLAFYPAEEYHQNYFQKNPNEAYCQTVINPKLNKFRERFSNFLEVN
ncbi:MAG: bifunctional methionine sulfoxide reductase B/A protein [Candidatus Magasanikiibacteriota bacterium]